MFRKLLFGSVVGLGLLVPTVFASAAQAHEWHHGRERAHWHGGFHVGVPVYRPRVYVAPAPVYVTPAPVYVQIERRNRWEPAKCHAQYGFAEEWNAATLWDWAAMQGRLAGPRIVKI